MERVISEPLDKIMLVDGVFFREFFCRFIIFLKENYIHHVFERQHNRSIWLIDIDGDKCIVKSFKKEQIAYLEGWLPEYEIILKAGVHLKSPVLTEEDYAERKGRILENIQRKFSFKPSDFYTNYTDDTVITKGYCQGTKLCNIQARKLIKLAENTADINLKNYVAVNLEKLQQRALFEDYKRVRYEEKQKQKRRSGVRAPVINNPMGIVTFKCKKNTFATKKMALDSIVGIEKSNRNKKRPIRAYECVHCSGWHLTSKTNEEYLETIENFADENDFRKYG